MKKLYKIGEVSSLYHIGPDSLRYYEDLGLLSPERDTNGYRLYSIKDMWKLNVIRDMREVGFNMEQIKTYLTNRSISSTKALLEDELQAIQNKIEYYHLLLNDVKTRLSNIENSENQTHGIVQKNYFPLRHCYAIHKGYDNDEEMDILIKQLINKDPDNLYILGNNRIGSVISLDSIKNEHYNEYSSVYIMDKSGDEIIEEGCYLTLTYQGSYSQNSIYIPILLEYAKRENLVPVDSVLELVWIDIHLTEDPGEHVTELQMWCREKK